MTEFSFNGAIDVNLDSDVQLNMVEKFPNLAKDEKARISLIAFDTEKNNSPLLKLSQYYYVEVNENNKFSFEAPLQNKSLMAKLISRYGDPKIRFITIILRYATDKNGIPFKNAEGKVDFTYYVWLLGTDKWKTLKSMHQEWNLYGRDVIIFPDGKSDLKYQNLTMQPAQDCLWKHLPDAQAIAEHGLALYRSAMNKFLPNNVPEEELAIKLGWDAADSTPNEVNPFAQAPQMALPAGNAPQAQITQQAGTATAESPFNKLVKPAS